MRSAFDFLDLPWVITSSTTVPIRADSSTKNKTQPEFETVLMFGVSFFLSLFRKRPCICVSRRLLPASVNVTPL